MVQICWQYLVVLSIGQNYKDEVWYDMVSMVTCHSVVQTVYDQITVNYDDWDTFQKMGIYLL